MWRALMVLVAGVARADLSDDDLRRKHEGGYVTGFPLFAYSVDFGFGAGARAYYYFNGDRDDPRFSKTPYLVRTFLNVFAASRGLQFHWLDLDAPRIFQSKYRVRSQLILAHNTSSNYFGFDDDARDTLRFPGSGSMFDTYDSYDAAQRQVVGGEAFTKYDLYDLLRPALLATVERSIFRERVRVMAGLGLSYAHIKDFTGTVVDATAADGSDTTAPEAPTRLREDCDRGVLVGCTGGRDNVLKFGVTYDTRDFEPDPNRGVYLDLSIDVGTVAIGSEFDYFSRAVRRAWLLEPVPGRRRPRARGARDGASAE